MEILTIIIKGLAISYNLVLLIFLSVLASTESMGNEIETKLVYIMIVFSLANLLLLIL